MQGGDHDERTVTSPLQARRLCSWRPHTHHTCLSLMHLLPPACECNYNHWKTHTQTYDSFDDVTDAQTSPVSTG